MNDVGRAFDGFTPESKPCPVCVELAQAGTIQGRAVMPLPKFPARLRADNRACCIDCQATETTMAVGGQHPKFGAARLTVANERVEGTVMPRGLMEVMGMCNMGYMKPSSIEDLDAHIDWLESNNINSVGANNGTAT